MKNKSGITLIELLIVMAIFSVVMAGLNSAYQVQVRQGVKEFRQSQTSIELSIADNMIERDMMMAGYGLGEDYADAPAVTVPRPVGATNGALAPDTLILMGTAIGMQSRASQGWSYLANVPAAGPPNFMQWGDMREEVVQNDVTIVIEPSSKQLLVNAAGIFLFRFNDPNSDLTSVPGNNAFTFNPQQAGTVLFGFFSMPTPMTLIAGQPYAVVTYTLGGAPLANCAPGTQSLLRAESRNGPGGVPQPLINCVLDFQVAFGLDWTETGSITTWDNGGVLAATLGGTTGITVLNRRLKQIRAYVLVQEGNRDPNYTYSNPDTLMAPDVIRVGELGLQGGATGRVIPPLTAEQRRYRWKMLTFAVTPRNI